MSELYVRQVNQALAQARVLIDACESENIDAGWSQATRRDAFFKAAVFHLVRALFAYRREIADRSNLAADAIDSLQDLIDLFSEKQQITAEVGELRNLSEQKQSWLFKIESCYAACWDESISVGNPALANSKSEIGVMQLDASSQETLEPEELDFILSELSSLIYRHRSAMQEW